jgi:hypothetical protein
MSSLSKAFYTTWKGTKNEDLNVTKSRYKFLSQMRNEKKVASLLHLIGCVYLIGGEQNNAMVGTESDFLGVIDLVTMEAVVWRGEELGFPLNESNDIDLVDDTLKAKATEYHV